MFILNNLHAGHCFENAHNIEMLSDSRQFFKCSYYFYLDKYRRAFFLLSLSDSLDINPFFFQVFNFGLTVIKLLRWVQIHRKGLYSHSQQIYLAFDADRQHTRDHQLLAIQQLIFKNSWILQSLLGRHIRLAYSFLLYLRFQFTFDRRW